MQTGLIIRRNAGQTVPAEYLALALQNNPKGWGAAIVQDGEVQVNKGHELDAELFNETVKVFDKNDITFYLCNSDAALNGDDCSPFDIIVKDDKVLLAAFVDGNFPSYDKPKSSSPAEVHFVKEWLGPKLNEYYDLGEMDLVMKAIKKDNFKKELMLNVVSRGVITLVTTTESLTFAQADTSAEFDWGWVSNHYGYGQASKETAPPKAEPARKSMFPNKSTVREKAPVPASSAVAKAVEAPKTETAAVKNYTTKKEAPPRNLSRNEKKKWYKNRVGFLPDGWMENVEIEVYVNPQGKLMTYGEVKKLGMSAVGLPKLNNPARVEDTQPENIPEKQTVPVGQEKKVETSLIPIMSPNTREHIKRIMADTKVQKLLGENADIITDPTKAKQQEEMFASFCSQLGIKDMTDFFPWSYEMMFNLGRERPDGLASMCWTFRNMLASKMAKEASKTEHTTDPSEVDPPVKESVPTAPVQKRSMFPNKKVA